MAKSRAAAPLRVVPKKARMEEKPTPKSGATTLNANVEAKHLAYEPLAKLWKKTRAFVAGADFVRDFIRKLPGHDKAEHEAFKAMAYFLPAVGRTQEAFAGLIMNPEPVITFPPELDAYVKDVTNDGEPMRRMIGRVVEEVVSVSRCAVLVDFPRVDDATQISVAEAEAQGLRAYARFYRAEDILDWRTSTYGGQRYLSFIKLQEKHIEKVDEWTSKEVPQIRVLDFDDAGYYRVRLYRRSEAGWLMIGKPVTPECDGKPMEDIPIVVFGPASLDPTEAVKPLLNDMISISESHLNDSGLMQWALMWVGNPTAVFRGLQRSSDSEPIRLGSSQGIVCSADGGAEILYLPAEGVGAIRQTMEDKRRDMAAVGARILADETSGQIARDTAVIQRAGEHSVLAGVANTVGDGFEKVLRLLAMWSGVALNDDENAKDGQVLSVKLNTDYVPIGLQTGELADLMDAVLKGYMSSRDLFALLQKKGAIRPDKSFEEHQDEVEEDDQRIVDNPRTGINDPATQQADEIAKADALAKIESKNNPKSKAA